MLSPQRRQQMDAVLHGSAPKPQGLTPERRAQMEAVLRPTPKKSVGGFISNAITSGANLAMDTGKALVNVFNPNMQKNTVANLGRLAGGAMQMLDPTERQLWGNGNEQMVRDVGKFYKQRYGGWKNIGETLYKDPFGAAADVAGVLAGAGGSLRTGGSLAVKAGAIGKGTRLAQVGTKMISAGNAIDPLVQAARLPGRIARPVASGLSKVADSEKLLTRGMGNPVAQAKAAQKAGQSTGTFMKKYNWYDRSPETAGQIKQDILSRYDAKALDSGTEIPLGKMMTEIDKQITALQKGVNGIVSDSDLQAIEELTRRREQLRRAVGGTETSSPIFAKTRDTALFRKQVLDKDIPTSTFGLDAQSKGKAGGVKMTRDIIREGINSTDPELAQLGLDYGQAKTLEKVAQGAAARAENRQLFNFTKLGTAGVGGFFAGIPGAIGGFAFEQMVNHPKFLKIAAQVMDKLSEVLPETKVIQQNPQVLYKEILEAANKHGSTNPEVLAEALAERYMKEPAYKEIIDDMGRQVASEFDGSMSPAPLKGRDRATEKIVNDAVINSTPESATRIKDISRNTIVIPDYRQADRTARSLTFKNRNLVYDPKRNFFENPTPAGYRGVNTNLKTPVGMSEIQINVPEMIVAKMPIEDAVKMLGKKQFNKLVAQGLKPGVGHKLYEKQRVIDERAMREFKARAAKPENYVKVNEMYYTADEVQQMEKLNKASNALYDRAMKLHKQNRSGILPTMQAYGFTKHNAKNALFGSARAGRMNREQ